MGDAHAVDEGAVEGTPVVFAHGREPDVGEERGEPGLVVDEQVVVDAGLGRPGHVTQGPYPGKPLTAGAVGGLDPGLGARDGVEADGRVVPGLLIDHDQLPGRDRRPCRQAAGGQLLRRDVGGGGGVGEEHDLLPAAKAYVRVRGADLPACLVVVEPQAGVVAGDHTGH